MIRLFLLHTQLNSQLSLSRRFTIEPALLIKNIKINFHLAYKIILKENKNHKKEKIVRLRKARRRKREEKLEGRKYKIKRRNHWAKNKEHNKTRDEGVKNCNSRRKKRKAK